MTRVTPFLTRITITAFALFGFATAAQQLVLMMRGW
jgi:hypothetical protein